MKRRIWVVTLVVVLGGLTADVRAQDPLVAAPGMYRLLTENSRIRVMEVTFQPGQKIAPHSHPDHIVYVIAGGNLRISHSDGTSMDADLKPDQVMWIPAEKHWAENTGTSVIRLLVTELKEEAAEAVAVPSATAP